MIFRAVLMIYLLLPAREMLSLETLTLTAGEMVKEGKVLAKIHKNVVIKVPRRAMLDDPVLAAGVGELLEDLEAAIERGELPPLDARYMARVIPNATLHVMQRGGHLILFDEPAAAGKAIGGFLEQNP